MMCIKEMPNFFISCFMISLLLAAVVPATFAQPTEFCSTDLPLVIPSDGTLLNHALTVDKEGIIKDLNVEVYVLKTTHVGELALTLEHEGVQVKLIDRPGFPTLTPDRPETTLGCTGWSIPYLMLDDEADENVEKHCHNAVAPAYRTFGSYQPNDKLSQFDGQDMSGTWTLSAQDQELSNPTPAEIGKFCLYFDFTPPGSPSYHSDPAPDSTIEFGEVDVGKSSSQGIEISNDKSGSTDLKISFDSITGDQNSFAIDMTSAPTFGPLLTIPGGKTSTLKVKCDASTFGEHAATLKLTTNDPVNPITKYDLSCTGLGAGYESVPISPDETLDFGDSLVENATRKAFQIKSIGNQDLEITNISITGSSVFKIIQPYSFPTIVTTENNIIVEAQCTSSSLGTHSAQLMVETNLGKIFKYQLNSNCFDTQPRFPRIPLYHSLPKPDETIKFGKISAGSSVEKTLFITEINTADLEISQVEIIGDSTEKPFFHPVSFSVVISDNDPLSSISNIPYFLPINIKCAPPSGVEPPSSPQLKITAKVSGFPQEETYHYPLECTREPTFADYQITYESATGTDIVLAPDDTFYVGETQEEKINSEKWETIEKALVIHNPGDAELKVTFGGMSDGQPDAFEVDFADELSVASHEEKTVTVTCKPTKSRSNWTHLKLTAHDLAPSGNSQTFTYKLECFAFEDKAAIYNSASVPPGGTIDFGSTPIGTDVQTRFNLVEDGNSLLWVDLAKKPVTGEHANDFKIIDSPFPLFLVSTATGPEVEIKIQCHPNDIGERQAALNLITNGWPNEQLPHLPSPSKLITDSYPWKIQYQLTCLGTQPGFHSTPAPSSTLHFGQVTVGENATQLIEIEETGNEDVTLNSAIIVGDHAEHFRILEPSFPLTIADGGDKKTITVQCEPLTDGLHQVNLELTNNDPKNSSVFYNLECEGIGGTVPGNLIGPPPGSTSGSQTPTTSTNQPSTTMPPVSQPPPSSSQLAACPNQNIIYVNQNANGKNSGENWTNAFSDLQAALNLAINCINIDQIWVAKGVYKPTTDNDRTATFQLLNGVAIYGGFAGTETQFDERDGSNNLTILSGDIGAIDDNSDNSYHVVTGSGTDATAILDGFIITAGHANEATGLHHCGGGLFNDNGSPTITYVFFRDNLANQGGGLCNWHQSHPTVKYSFFHFNSATEGGGIFNADYSHPIISHVFVSNNLATQSGGGILNRNNSDSLLSHVNLNGNSAGSGGGIYNENSSPVVSHSILTGNEAEYRGGGMVNDDNSQSLLSHIIFSDNNANLGGALFNNNSNPILTQATLSGNSATNGGGIVNVASFLAVKNSILWKNSDQNGNTMNAQINDDTSSETTVTYSIVQGGWTGSGSNNKNEDPLFIHVENKKTIHTTVKDFHLDQGSPAIDAGNNADIPQDRADAECLEPDGNITELVELDFDGKPRRVDGDGDGNEVVDMGAYEASSSDIPNSNLNVIKKGTTTNNIINGHPTDINCEGPNCSPPPLNDMQVVLPKANSSFEDWETTCEGCEAVLDETLDNISIEEVTSSSCQNILDGSLVNLVCNLEGQTKRDITVGETGNLSDVVLEGTIRNQGRISNATLQPDSILTGGFLSGDINNNGTISNIEFIGSKLEGGFLSGIINNSSPIGGVINNVFLAPNTRIKGGKVAGSLIGNFNAPARLENLTVSAGSCLENVTLGNNVQLPAAGDFSYGPCVNENSLTLTSSATEGPAQTLYLAPKAHLTDQELVGRFQGDANYPARLDSVTISRGSYVSNVIIGQNVINEGTIADAEFQGAILKNGTLAGKIQNTGGGTLENVHLAAGMELIGGNLKGNVSGESSEPARLTNLTVVAGSELDHVIIDRSSVTLAKDVKLGSGVQWLNQPTNAQLVDQQPKPDVAMALIQKINASNQIDYWLKNIPESSTAPRFSGKIRTHKTLQTNHAMLTYIQAEKVSIEMTIKVASKHKGQAGELFAVLVHSFQGSQTYSMRLKKKWKPWNGNVENLQPFQTESHLPKELKISLLDQVDLSKEVGEYTVYIGYHPENENDTLFYNGIDPTHFFVDTAPPSCMVYAVHDQNQDDSQLVKVDLSYLGLNGVMTELGPLHLGRNIEGLALHPLMPETLYGTSGKAKIAGENFNGYLYAIERATGEISPIGPTGFEKVPALAINPADETMVTLWAWAANQNGNNQWQGLIRIDPNTGAGTPVKQFNDKSYDIAGLAWSPDGSQLYASDKSTLLVYDPETQELEVACKNVADGKIEGLDMQPNGFLLLGVDHGEGGETSIVAYDPKACKEVNKRTFKGLPFYDIESVIWPAKECYNQSWLVAND